MNETQRMRVDQVTYSHDYASDSRSLAPGFRQVMHIAGFHCIITSHKLTVLPGGEYESVEAVQQAIEPSLRDWELRSEFLDGHPLLFTKTGHVARNASTGGQHIGIGTAREREHAQRVIAVTITDHITVTDAVHRTSARVRLHELQPLEITDDVKAVQERWRAVRDEREPLLSGAYWILTKLQNRFGDRPSAARGLIVGLRVLDEVGRLTAVNDPVEGRKVKKAEQTLSGAERHWLISAIPRLIYRFAETESGYRNLEEIKMSDLPFTKP